MEVAEILERINVTQEQVDEWKKTYGEDNVHLLSVTPKNSDDTRHCIVRTPDRLAMKRVAEAALDNPVKASEVLLDCTWLAGDVIIKKDERYFYTAAEQVSKLREKGEATIAKL